MEYFYDYEYCLKYNTIYRGKSSSLHIEKEYIHYNSCEDYDEYYLLKKCIGDSTVIKYYVQNHNSFGPALINYDYNGSIIETWYKYGYVHRENGPAKIYYQHGNVIESQWYNYHRLHRIDGPAIINEFGEFYYLWDDELSKEEFYK